MAPAIDESNSNSKPFDSCQLLVCLVLLANCLHQWKQPFICVIWRYANERVWTSHGLFDSCDFVNWKMLWDGRFDETTDFPVRLTFSHSNRMQFDGEMRCRNDSILASEEPAAMGVYEFAQNNTQFGLSRFCWKFSTILLPSPFDVHHHVLFWASTVSFRIDASSACRMVIPSAQQHLDA